MKGDIEKDKWYTENILWKPDLGFGWIQTENLDVLIPYFTQIINKNTTFPRAGLKLTREWSTAENSSLLCTCYFYWKLLSAEHKAKGI